MNLGAIQEAIIWPWESAMNLNVFIDGRWADRIFKDIVQHWAGSQIFDLKRGEDRRRHHESLRRTMPKHSVTRVDSEKDADLVIITGDKAFIGFDFNPERNHVGVKRSRKDLSEFYYMWAELERVEIVNKELFDKFPRLYEVSKKLEKCEELESYIYIDFKSWGEIFEWMLIELFRRLGKNRVKKFEMPKYLDELPDYGVLEISENEKEWQRLLTIREWSMVFSNVIEAIKGFVPQKIEQEIQVDSSGNLQEQILNLLPQFNVDERSVDMLRKYCAGSSQDQIAESLGVTQSTIAVGFNEIREQIGYVFEQVYSARLTDDGILHRLGGANTPEPDIVIYDESGDPKEVISLKCYITARNRRGTTIGRKEIAKSELELKEQGVPLFIVFYDIVADRLFPKVLVEDQLTFTFKRRE